MYKNRIVTLGILIIILFCQKNNGADYRVQRLLIIETENNPAYHYRTLQQLSNNVGFEASIAHFYDIPDLEQYDAVFLLMSRNFLSNFDIHDVFKTVIPKLQTYAQNPKEKIIGLIFPYMLVNKEKHTEAMQQASKLFELFNIPSAAYGDTISYMLQPSIVRATKEYQTSLFPKGEKYPAELLPLPSIPAAMQETTLYLPSTTNLFTPMGVMIKAGSTNFFISTTSLIDAQEIEENFRTNPMERSTRSTVLYTVQATLQELHNALTHATNAAPANLPFALSSEKILQQKIKYQALRRKEMNPAYAWADHSNIKAAWLEIKPYTNNETLLTKGVRSILDAKFNLLWMELVPELFLSRCILRDKSKKQCDFFNNISLFTNELKKQSEELGVPIPHLFVGSTPTTNLYTREAVINPVADMTGSKLHKIPTPFDWENLWKPEVVEPFATIVHNWQNSSGNGIPLAGIFIDFEMYHAQDQANEYTNMMDFGDYIWELYTLQQFYMSETTDPELPVLKTPEERASYLIRIGALPAYTRFLQKKAYEIGKKLRENIRKILPNAMIGAYTMTLPNNWFLLGVLAGLSTPQDPIILATFNNEAYNHFDYLRNNGIYCFHVPALLLSKFESAGDFSLINRAQEYNDGVWINKFSRLVQEKGGPDDWGWGNETSDLGLEATTEGIKSAFDAFLPGEGK